MAKEFESIPDEVVSKRHPLFQLDIEGTAQHGRTAPHRCTSKGSTSEFCIIVASLAEPDTSELPSTPKTPLDVHTNTHIGRERHFLANWRRPTRPSLLAVIALKTDEAPPQAKRTSVVLKGMLGC
jgi:hypothetical protein